MGRCLANRWLAVTVWTAVIFTAIPFVRELREAFVARWPGEFLAYAVIGIVAAATAGALLRLRHQKGALSPPDIAWLSGCAAVLIAWTRLLMGQPEEAIHFVEYGVLGVLLYRALRPRVNDVGVFVAGALLGTIVGTVDEIIQWVVPGRFWDLRDLVLNGGASILVQIAIWRLVPRPASRLAPRTLRSLCRLAAVEVLILVVCLAATPQRLGALALTYPALEALSESDDVMCEYGFLHRLDSRTLFRSRLSLSELAHQDRSRPDEAAAKLDRSGGRYGEFLKKVSPASDPFTHEARVHVFARDRSLAEARRHAVGSREHRRSMTAAARENRILESIFGETLSRSIFPWAEARLAVVDAAQNPDARYVSRVAGHLITRVSEPVLRALMLGMIAALLAADLSLSRRLSRFPPPPGLD